MNMNKSIKEQGKILLRRRDVADKLGVCSHTVMRLTKDGILPAMKFNRRLIRYDPEVVQKFIDGCREKYLDQTHLP